MSNRTIKCLCGIRLNRRNIGYYIDEFNERVPICKKCIKVIKEYQQDDKNV